MPDAGRPTILLVGANGQVGRELCATLPSLGSVVPVDRAVLDLTDVAAIRQVVRAIAPDLIVNAAAYTQVDRAESEPALAHRVNAEAVAVLADEARRCDALLVHYSTDYVFDGCASVPYHEGDVANPLNIYGRTKLAGDLAILGSGARACIFRVGWVYGTRGRNFLRTIQRLLADGRELRIVADQFGAPTWSRAIAIATGAALQVILRGRCTDTFPVAGAYHMAPPDYTSWAGFAQAIVDASTPSARRTAVIPISTDDFLTAARRPAWSVLDSTKFQSAFGLCLPSWKEQLTSCLEEPSV